MANNQLWFVGRFIAIIFCSLFTFILADPRSYGSYGPSSASASNATWQVGPPQGNSYGQGRTPSGGPTGNPGNTAVGPPQSQGQYGGANSNSAQYPYPAWSYSQPQGSQGPPSAGPPPPNQYNYGADSSNGPPSGFAYPAATGYDHFSSDSAPPPNYSRWWKSSHTSCTVFRFRFRLPSPWPLLFLSSLFRSPLLLLLISLSLDTIVITCVRACVCAVLAE